MCELSDCGQRSAAVATPIVNRAVSKQLAVFLLVSLLWHCGVASAQLDTSNQQVDNETAKASRDPGAVVLGFVRLVNGRITTWGPQWKPIDLPVPPVSVLKEQETTGVFRVTENARLNGSYLREGQAFPFSKIWRSATDPTIIFATMDIPADRYSGTVSTSVAVAAGSKSTIALTAEDVGKRRYVGQLKLDSIFDLKSQDNESIQLSVVRERNRDAQLFAETIEGTLVPSEIIDDTATLLYPMHVTRLRFYVPIEKLSGIAIAQEWERIEELESANLPLQPEIVPKPRRDADAEAARSPIPKVSDSHTLRLSLSNGAVADVLGVGRLHNDQPQWWSVDGKDRVEIADVTAGDLVGLGTVVAMKLYEYSSATPYLERDGQRKYIGEHCVSKGSGVILLGLDPKDEQDSEDLSISIAAAKPEILQRVDVTHKSDSIPKTDSRIISQLLKAEPAGPDQCSVSFNYQSNGLLKFLGINRSGAIVIPSSGLIAANYATITFPVPLEQLQEIFVQHYPRENLKLEGIALRAGNITRPAASRSVATQDDEQLQLIRDRDDGSNPPGMMPPAALGMLASGLRVKGNLVDTDGKPISDVPIFSGYGISELRRNPHPKVFCRTDANGEFEFRKSLRTPLHDVAGMNDDGFGIAEFDHPDVPVRIVLRPWGKVSGSVRLGDKPVANEKVQLWWFETQTDADGKFEFPKVPFGQAELASNLNVARILGRPDAGDSWIRTDVFVDSGKTTTVDLGGHGRTVVGRITVPEDYTDKIKLDGARCQVERRQPEPPYPPGSRSEYQKRIWYKKWAGEPAGRSHLKTSLRLSFSVNAEGVFVIRDVPAGDYELTVGSGSANGGRNAMFLFRKFTIEDDPSNTPISLGEISSSIIGP